MKKKENGPLLVNKLFGSKLAEARRARDLTQSALAERMGLSRITIANLECGRQNVQLHQIFSIAEALDVPPEQLIPTMRDVNSKPSSIDSVFLELVKSRLTSLNRVL